MKTEKLKLPILLQLLAFVQFIVVLFICIKSNYSKNDIYVMSIISILVLLILLFSKLTIKINDNKLQYSCIPFSPSYKTINKTDIKTAYIGSSSSFSNIIGYGLRFSRKYGKGYMFDSNNALYIELINGEKIVFSIIDPSNYSKFIN